MGWLKSLPPPEETLQVLSFQFAKTMSRLIALHASLSDDEFSRLRSGPIRSTGVTYLNSNHDDNEASLLNLACTEKLEELDSLAATVSRLSHKCTDMGLHEFDAVYSNLKQGIINFNPKQADKAIGKMERWVTATSALQAALASLSGMESKLKLRRLNLDLQNEKTRISLLGKQVKKYKEMSLWNKTFDDFVGPMGLVICAIFSRICDLFGDSVPDLPKNVGNNHLHNNPVRWFWRVHPEVDNRYCVGYDQEPKSGPIIKAQKKWDRVCFYSGEFSSTACLIRNKKEDKGGRGTLAQSAPPNTVGGAGLALRYANVIILAETQLYAPVGISEDARGYIYEMLTGSLRAKIRGKLVGRRGQGEEDHDNDDDGNALAEGWRDGVEGILEWLGPMARDTVQWHAERNLEKQRFDPRPKVLLFQTLYFSDLEKTEAAIVEVFVGLSFIYKYERRRLRRHGFVGAGRRFPDR